MTSFKWIIYTDGSCIDNGLRGGYSALIYYKNKLIKKIYQGFKNTTNNRMELLAVIEALKLFKHSESILIISDSQYVVNSINGKHCFKWIKNNDLSKKNLDLWFELVELLSFHKVTFQWVKGHSDNDKNELADLLACHAAQCLNLKEDQINTKWNDTVNNDSKIR